MNIKANPNPTNSEMDSKTAIKHPRLNDGQRDELIQQYAELCIDSMDHKDMYSFIYNTLTEDFDKLTDSELQDEIECTHDKELYEELVDNVTQQYAKQDVNNPYNIPNRF